MLRLLLPLRNLSRLLFLGFLSRLASLWLSRHHSYVVALRRCVCEVKLAFTLDDGIEFVSKVDARFWRKLQGYAEIEYVESVFKAAGSL